MLGELARAQRARGRLMLRAAGNTVANELAAERAQRSSIRSVRVVVAFRADDPDRRCDDTTA